MRTSTFVLFNLSTVTLVCFAVTVYIVQFCGGLFARRKCLAFTLPIAAGRRVLIGLFSTVICGVVTFTSVFITFLVAVSNSVLARIVGSTTCLVVGLFRIVRFGSKVGVAFTIVCVLVVVFLSLVGALLLFCTYVTLNRASEGGQVLVTIMCCFLCNLVARVVSAIVSVFFGLLFVFNFRRVNTFVRGGPCLYVRVFFVSLVLFVITLGLVFCFMVCGVVGGGLGLRWKNRLL